jgi:hypothetical protein
MAIERALAAQRESHRAHISSPLPIFAARELDDFPVARLRRTPAWPAPIPLR